MRQKFRDLNGKHHNHLSKTNFTLGFFAFGSLHEVAAKSLNTVNHVHIVTLVSASQCCVFEGNKAEEDFVLGGWQNENSH